MPRISFPIGVGIVLLARGAPAQDAPADWAAPMAAPPAGEGAGEAGAAGAALSAAPGEADAGGPGAAAGEEDPLSVVSRPGLAAPSRAGASGLFHLRTAETGSLHSFRVGLHSQWFADDDFVVAGDSHSRFLGVGTLSYTPHRAAEVFGSLAMSRNTNTGRDPATARAPEVVLAQGDATLGAKGQFPVSEIAAIGPELALAFLSGVEGSTFDFGSTGVYFGAIATVDFTRLPDDPFPARLHANAGYRIDNSQELCPREESDGACDFSAWPQEERAVQEFGYGINHDRVQLGLGVDAPMYGGGQLWWRPIVEYRIDIATGEEDPDYLASGLWRGGDLDRRVAQTLTTGVRLQPVRGLSLALGVDWGLTSAGAAFGPVSPPWDLLLDVSYAYDPTPAVRTVEREVVKVVEKETVAPPPAGRVRGRVVDAETLEPIEGAIVTFPGRPLTGLATDPDGTFLSYPFDPGEVFVAVRHERYVADKATVAVEADKEAALELKLTPAKPPGGLITGRLVDRNGAPLSGLVRVAGTQNLEIATRTDGTFSAELPEGEYVARAEAPGRLGKERKLSLAPGETFVADFVLSPRPVSPEVTVRKNAIALKRPIEFTEDGALRPDAPALLDEVLDAVLSDPSIRLLRVEGHTDNRGPREDKLAIGTTRAESVRNYLVAEGLDPGRVEAAGIGPARPIAPNYTIAGRKRNNRIELKVAR